MAIFMVEQNANMALSIADRGWVLLTGRVILDDTAERGHTCQRGLTEGLSRRRFWRVKNSKALARKKTQQCFHQIPKSAYITNRWWHNLAPKPNTLHRAPHISYFINSRARLNRYTQVSQLVQSGYWLF